MSAMAISGGRSPGGGQMSSHRRRESEDWTRDTSSRTHRLSAGRHRCEQLAQSRYAAAPRRAVATSRWRVRRRLDDTGHRLSVGSRSRTDAEL